MGKESKIEWTDHTFNPWIGCTKISPGCQNCYAEREDNRRHWTPDGWGPGKDRHRTSPNYWGEVINWNLRAAKAGRRESVFCASLADWLDEEVPIHWLADLLELIRVTTNLRWLLLTKRPLSFHRLIRVGRFLQQQPVYNGWVERWFHGIEPLENVWLGLSVENQEALKRVDVLSSQISMGQNLFLSCEPLLGPLDLKSLFRAKTVDWVIAGGESGPGARAAHVDWFRSLRDQCADASVPFFFKQWGDWIDQDQEVAYQCALGERTHAASGLGVARQNFLWPDRRVSRRVGKGSAGNLLDGVRHQAFPWKEGE
jgi:protein gp37